VFDVLLKFSMLNNFGGAYTLSNLDMESFYDIQCMQICLKAVSTAEQMASRKNTMHSKEALGIG